MLQNTSKVSVHPNIKVNSKHFKTHHLFNRIKQSLPYATLITGKEIDDVLRELREKHQRYKYVEQEIVQRKQRLTYKEPEIKKCLDAVTLLIQRKEAGEDQVCWAVMFLVLFVTCFNAGFNMKVIRQKQAVQYQKRFLSVVTDKCGVFVS